MILLVDAGNTRAKWRLTGSDGASVKEGFDLASMPSALAQLGVDDAPQRVAVSSVGSDQATNELDRLLQAYTSAPVYFHWPRATAGGLRNSYADVTRMGADRWHAMVAAWREFAGGVAVVDAGSAVTVDYIDSGGQHLGGFILPGLAMMLRSLSGNTARVIFEPKEHVDTRPGTNTSDAVNHGCDWLISALSSRIRQDCTGYGIDSVVVTGGDAWRWNRLGLNAVHRPGLVLDGLFWADREMHKS